MQRKEVKPIALVLFSIILAVLLSGCLESSRVVEIRNESAVKTSVFAEVADTEPEWRQGLMNRTLLGEHNGMLFIFPEAKVQNFWMKDTKLPLDIIYADAEGVIVKIAANLQPCQSDPCPIYSSEQPAQYTLEVNTGFAERNAIKVGDVLVMPA